MLLTCESRWTGHSPQVSGLLPSLFPPLAPSAYAQVRCVISSETAPPFPGQLPPPCPLTPAPITSYGNSPPASSQAEPARSPLPARSPVPHTVLIHGSVFPAKWWDQRAGVGLVPPTVPLHQADSRALLPHGSTGCPARSLKTPPSSPKGSLQGPSVPTVPPWSSPLANGAGCRLRGHSTPGPGA